MAREKPRLDSASDVPNQCADDFVDEKIATLRLEQRRVMRKQRGIELLKNGRDIKGLIRCAVPIAAGVERREEQERDTASEDDGPRTR